MEVPLILTQDDMLRRILDTKAVSIWNHKTGPIFWYAASIPGPFYVNTELVLGKELSAALLKDITSIIAETPAPKERAEKLERLILDAYESDAFFQSIIETMEAKLTDAFGANSFSVISGGERRDWLFSIPLAKKMDIKHAYLFKNGDLYCAQALRENEPTIHVSDLINNAASYFDAWFPILEKNKLNCVGTMCVNSRGSNGVDRLHEAGQKVVAINSVDIGFFESCCASGLVEKDVVDELRVFFDDPKAWASTYVMDRPELFNVGAIDAKSFDRLCTFFSKDPWALKEKHGVFFAEMQKTMTARQAS
jgi:orotate phosphoribosyltransferase